jgi:hypothetical protein
MKRFYAPVLLGALLMAAMPVFAGDKHRSEPVWYAHTERNWKLDKSVNAPVNVPEPGSLPLLMIGLAAVGFIAYRRKGDGFKAAPQLN